MKNIEVYCSCGNIHTVEYDFELKHIALVKTRKGESSKNVSM